MTAYTNLHNTEKSSTLGICFLPGLEYIHAKYMPGNIDGVNCDEYIAPVRAEASSRGIKGIDTPENETAGLAGASI